MELLTTINTFWENIIHIITNMSGRTEQETKTILLITTGYIIILFLLMIIHRNIIKKHKKILENVTFLYDTIRYKVAKAQYENPTIQNTKGIKIIIDTDKKEYLPHIKAIKEEIMAIEQRLNQQIIGNDERNMINKQTKKEAVIRKYKHIIGRCITCITGGMYKLFR